MSGNKKSDFFKKRFDKFGKGGTLHSLSLKNSDSAREETRQRFCSEHPASAGPTAAAA
jgi:hypothetical protein